MGYITCSIHYLTQIIINNEEIYLQHLSEICSIFASNGASEIAKFCSSNYLAPNHNYRVSPSLEIRCCLGCYARDY